MMGRLKNRPHFRPVRERLSPDQQRFLKRRPRLGDTAFRNFNVAACGPVDTFCRGYLGHLAGRCDCCHLLEPTILPAKLRRFLAAIHLVGFPKIASRHKQDTARAA